MMCPFCHFQGNIYKAKIEGIEETVYICDECDALWYGPYLKNIGSVDDDATNLTSFVEDHGLSYESCKIVDLGYDWDKSIIKDPYIIFCPLCGSRGIIYKTWISKLGIHVYFCDICDAMWHEGQEIKADNCDNLLQFLNKKGFKYYSGARLENFTLDWSKPG